MSCKHQLFTSCMYVLQVCIANLIIDCLVCMSCSSIDLSCMYVLPISTLYIFHVRFSDMYCKSDIECLACMSCWIIKSSCMYVLRTSILYILYVRFSGTYCTSEIDYCEPKIDYHVCTS